MKHDLYRGALGALLIAVGVAGPVVGQDTLSRRHWPALVGSSTVLLAATWLDAESTVQGMRRGYHEANPFWLGVLGSTGDRLRVYAVSTVPVLGVMVLSAELDRRGKSWWWVPIATGTVLHLSAGLMNYSLLRGSAPLPVLRLSVPF